MAQHVENLAPPAGAVVTVSKSLGPNRAHVAWFVAEAVGSVLGDAARRVHVKVKRAGRAKAWGVEVGDELVPVRSRSAASRLAIAHGLDRIQRLKGDRPEGVRAWAYDGVPYSAHPGCDYLITMHIGRPRSSYPAQLTYRATVPMEVRSHTEEVVIAAAHEAHHTHQFIEGLPRSEVDCDRIALATLAAFRGTAGIER